MKKKTDEAPKAQHQPREPDPVCKERGCQLQVAYGQARNVEKEGSKKLRKARRVIAAIAALIDPSQLDPEMQRALKRQLHAHEQQERQPPPK